MSERNKSTDAIILTIKNLGETNRLVTFFSPETGISSSVLYGGAKSKMKSLLQPFNHGILYIYNDEVKNTSKIRDFDVKDFYLNMKQNLYKMMAANLACEIILKTKAAGDYKNAFVLLNAFLKGLDLSSENESRLGTIRFLFRYLTLLGLQVNPHICCDCQESLLSKENESFYLHHKNGFVCGNCINHYDKNERIFPLDKYALTYIAAINDLSPSKVRSLVIPQKSAWQMKNLVFNLINNAAGGNLATLKNAASIL